MKDLSLEPLARVGGHGERLGKPVSHAVAHRATSAAVRRRAQWRGLLAALAFAAVACSGGGAGTVDPGVGPPPDDGKDDDGGGGVPALSPGADGLEREGAPAWRPLTFEFRTGATSPVHGGLPHADDPSPGNPALDWRMDLELTRPDGQTLRVPGFFAGDGDGGERGDVWRLRFTPPNVPGAWSGMARLRTGPAINVAAPDSAAGNVVFETPVRFFVQPAETAGTSGLWRRGAITAAGDGTLRHADGGVFLKAGVGSPENLLGYAGFDGAVDGMDGGPDGENGGAPDFLHRFETHVADWRPGDPDWRNGAGRGLAGALRYLGSAGANSLYVMPMNLGGDGRDTFPFTSNGGGAVTPPTADVATHYAVRRLEQWNAILEHAQSRGLFVQFVLAEREPTNIAWLGAAFGVPRRLFQKQMVAHFGHLPGVEWTLCEENAAPGTNSFIQFTPTELADMAGWIRAWDVDQHPLSVHIDPNDLSLYEAMIASGTSGWLDCVSLQIDGDEPADGAFYGSFVEAAASLFRTGEGREVVVHMDEPGHYETGAGSELHPGATQDMPWVRVDDRRRRVLYDVLLSGGGIAWYFGLWSEDDGGGDLCTEDFRTRGTLIRQTQMAKDLVLDTFRDTARPRPADELWVSDSAPDLLHSVFGNAEVLFAPGGTALVYLPTLGQGGTLNLGRLSRLDVDSDAGSRPDAFEAFWFDPRTGDAMSGLERFDPTLAYRPSPPNAPGPVDQDWVLVVRPRE